MTLLYKMINFECYIQFRCQWECKTASHNKQLAKINPGESS